MTDTAVAPAPQPAQVDLRKEYVTSTPDRFVSGLRQQARALPYYVDNLEAELPDDSYSAMKTDPQVSSSVDLLRASIIEDGVTLTVAIAPEGDQAAADLAAEILAFCQRVLDQLETPIDDVLWDMLEAIIYGTRIAEEVYEIPSEGDDAGRYVLRALKPKPRESIAFVVDPYLNVVGFLGARPGQARVLGGVTISDKQRSEILPREKFAVLTWRPHNSDPRGTSQLRAAYNPWWIKQQEWPEFIKLLFQFATPSVYGITAPKAEGDKSTGEDAQQLLLASLVNIQNGSAGAFPAGTEIDTIEAGEGGAAAFDQITELLNQEITKGILGSTRATMESEHGSRADSDTSKGLFDSLVRAGRRTVARMLQRDVINQTVELNFGKKAIALAPRVAVGGVEEEDKTPMMAAVAQLERAGYFDVSQRPGVDAQIGVPVRTPEEVEARKKRSNQPSPATTVAPSPLPGQGDKTDDSIDTNDTGDSKRPEAEEEGDDGDA